MSVYLIINRGIWIPNFSVISNRGLKGATMVTPH